ncbi:MAG: thiamine pyrophosphate-binding protein [Vicinamibacterales bacterium]
MTDIDVHGERADRSPAPLPRSGGRVLVDGLRGHGVTRVFCVPGESYLDVLDALHDTPEIDVVVAKHEGAAANMAEADGKLTGLPGICLVTRGPGATHATVGVHTARQDSTPMILFIGQVARGCRDREGFQEVAFPEMFAPLAKWSAQIDDAARIPEYLARAFQVATSGRMGPVVLSLPEDVLAETVVSADVPGFRPVAGAPRVADIAALDAALRSARRPLVVVGGSGWTEDARARLAGFAERYDLPVAASFRRQDVLDNRSEHYVGHLSLGIDPRLAAGVEEADLILAFGPRLGEVSSGGYRLVASPRPRQKLVHVHPDPDELGRVYQPDVGIPSSMPSLAEALDRLGPAAAPPWGDWRAALRRDYLEFSRPPARHPDHQGVHLATVVDQLATALPEDAVVTNGAGNYTVWVHRFYRYRGLRTELAPTSGAMGYGLPAAIAAKLRHPGRTVVCFAGDGCFLMYPQELGTALQSGAAIIVLVVNNGMYGTIRMHQERRFPGRVVGTDIDAPDFVGLARSFGAYAERVDRSEDFADAFARAQAAGRPAVLELRVDPAQITPTARLSAVDTQRIGARESRVAVRAS